MNVLFVIGVGTRRVRLAGVTGYPDGPWMTQQARELSMSVAEDGRAPRFVIRDRDTKFVAGFDTVFTADGTGIIYRSAERERERVRRAMGVQRTLRVPGLADSTEIPVSNERLPGNRQ